VIDFISVVIELFSLSPIRLRRYESKSVEVGFFEGVGHFERRFQREGGMAHQPLLVSE